MAFFDSGGITGAFVPTTEDLGTGASTRQLVRCARFCLMPLIRALKSRHFMEICADKQPGHWRGLS